MGHPRGEEGRAAYTHSHRNAQIAATIDDARSRETPDSIAALTLHVASRKQQDKVSHEH
jgi:hypothetical protein